MGLPKKDTALETAAKALRILSSVESVRLLAEAKDKAKNKAKALSGFNSAVSSAPEEGREERIEMAERRGEQRGREAVALNMLRADMSVKAVAKMAGLPLKRVKELASGLSD